MAGKSSLKTIIVTIGGIALTLVMLTLNFLSEKATSENMVRSVLTDIVFIVCMFLLIGILIMRGKPGYENNAHHKVN